MTPETPIHRLESMKPEIHFETSSVLDSLFAALAKAQATFPPVKKDKENPFFKSKYADLQTVIDAVKKPLSDNGLAFVQLPGVSNGAVVVTTLLGHSSGQWIRATLKMPTAKGDAQGIGSAITYARRYSLQALAGVSAEDDDDGNAAVNGNGQKPIKEVQRKSVAPAEVIVPDQIARATADGPDKAISEAQIKRLFAIAHEAGWKDNELKEWLNSKHGLTSSRMIPVFKYEQICTQVKNGGDAA